MQKEIITHLLYWLFKAKPSGLVKTEKDPRNFKTGLFNWGVYSPKHTRKCIETVSVKNQGTKNTCQWNATAVQKEIDENMPLSVRSLVAWGVKNGLVSGDGFSSLESGQKGLKKWGILEQGKIQENIDNWSEYSNLDLARFAKDAETHKTSSYWEVSSRNDILKLLDEGRTMTTGLDWYTGFNQGGGFSYPWIISKAVGYNVGGHAVLLIGYDLNYEGQRVYIFQNSYGALWGDSGKFYITMDYFDRNNYGCFVNLDIPSEIGKFLTEYDGKNVKGSKNTVYFIQKGVKKAYPDEVTYLAFNAQDGDIKSYSLVKDDILAKIPSGDNMDIEKSLYWDMLKNIEGKENRIKTLIEYLAK